MLSTIAGFLGIFVLLLCSALVSGAEIAFFSLSGSDLEGIEQDPSPADRRILYLKEHPRYLLATILVSNNFINIAIILLSALVLDPLLSEELFGYWGASVNSVLSFVTAEQWADFFKFLIVTVGISFLLVLFGEVTPKVYAKMNNLRLARFMARPLSFLMRILRPINAFLVKMTNLVESRLAKSNPSTNQPSREEIDEAIELTVSKSADADQEIDILKSIVKFGEVSVKQIMRPRVDVVAVDFRIDYAELLEIVIESGYSRIPVYDEEFDNVTGILYAKDLLGHLDEDKAFEWQTLIRTEMVYAPEAKKIDDLLKEFQQERLHMAIVVDEYGGTSGIVTLEDIMEEIIGEIKDEFDDEKEVDFQKVDDYQYIFEGKTLLNDVCRVIGIDTDTFDDMKGEADSLAGMVLEIYGGFLPKDGEVSCQGYTFRAIAVNKRRIERILITLPNG
ncbi:MAG: gliding motility-associated protein GldE [Bacteroidota bacterium]